MPQAATIAITHALKPEALEKIRGALPPAVSLTDYSHERREHLQDEADRIQVVYGPLNPDEFAALKALRWLHIPWSGIDGIAFDELFTSDVLITHYHGISAVAISEHTIGALLYLSRDFPAWQSLNRRHIWRERVNTALINGSVVLIVGMGEIGRVVARKLAGLGARVWGVNSDGRLTEPCERCFTLETVRPLLGEVDFLASLLPSTPRTHKALDRSFLAALKPGAGVVNISRGAVLDQDALQDLVQRGRLRGAVLDVTDPEPPPEDCRLFDDDRILLTGHRVFLPGDGDATPAPEDIFIQNLGAWSAGRPEEMRFKVNKELRY
jgi:phosphoglycerate dehydrogenase-like enzyme